MQWIKLTDRMPNPDAYGRVLIYTEGYDFNGEQVFDVKAETLNECFYADPDNQPEVCIPLDAASGKLWRPELDCRSPQAEVVKDLQEDYAMSAGINRSQASLRQSWHPSKGKSVTCYCPKCKCYRTRSRSDGREVKANKKRVAQLRREGRIVESATNTARHDSCQPTS